MEKFEKLFEIVGFSFADKKLLQEAFTHRSAVNDHSKFNVHNERLEFLGDAVLELVVTEFLYYQFPKKPEGDLTNLRAALVCGDHLEKVARDLSFGDFLILSRGEDKSGGREKGYLLANAVESFIGALFLHKGQVFTKKFIEQFICSDIDSILREKSYIDAKTAFQELSQSPEIAITPQYKVLSESGLDHEKTFIIGAFLNNKKVGEGSGNSKKEAQNAAAQDALENKEKWMK
jgi:ribonuclease-3